MLSRVKATTAARRAARSPLLTIFARVGFASRALVYIVNAALAVHIAFGEDEGSPDSRGALQAIAGQPFGRILLVALAVGFTGYALWRLGRAAFPTGDDVEKPGRRIAHLGSGALYVGILVVMVRFLAGVGGDDADREADLTAAVMGLPLGRWLVALFGLALVGASGWSVRRAVSRRFRRGLDTRKMSKGVHGWAFGSAITGLFARAIVQFLLGAFLVQAALQHDPSRTEGLDGALRAVGASRWGEGLLTLLAIGFLARGVFSAFEARYRKAT
jgi:hypothetical protein